MLRSGDRWVRHLPDRGAGLPRVLSYPPHPQHLDGLHGRAATLVHRDGLHRDGSPPRAEQLHDPDWVRDHAREWDIVHLHLWGGRRPVDELIAVVEAHRAAGVPVVATVHDLEPPHLPPDALDPVRLLTGIAPMLSGLLTLTRGCADAVRSLTGRQPTVVPHGPIVPASRRRRLRAHRRRRLNDSHILLHAGQLRPNLGLPEVVEACRLVRPHLPVRVQTRVGAADEVRAAVRGVPGIEVVEAPRLGDALFERTVADAAALLLPYRWGTHSGMLELAADVGTPVLHTDVGWLAEQPASRPAPPVPVHDRQVDVDTLARLLATPQPEVQPVTMRDRERAAAAVVDVHRRLYGRLLAGVEAAS